MWKKTITSIVISLSILICFNAFALDVKTQVGPYLQNVKQDEITVMWETNVPRSSRIDYGLTTDYGNFIEDPNRVTIHEITLPNLITGTTYHYKVTTANAKSADNTFKTAPQVGSGFSFVAYGDTRSNPDDHKAVINAILTHNPQTFVLHSGDIIERGNVYEQWQTQYFDPARDMLKNTTLFPSLGNHEENSLWYYDFFSVPKNSTTEAWYSFNYGNSHFVVLDTCQSFAPGGEQYTWLRKDLRSPEATEARWIFALFHHPPYSSGYHGRGNSQTVMNLRKYLVPLFKTSGVDVVFNGHEHFYERSYKDGIHYVTVGGGGAPLGNIGITPNPYRQYAERVHHHCIVDVSQDKVTITAYRKDGSVIDTVTIQPI